jgi:hypothetical protein
MSGVRRLLAHIRSIRLVVEREPLRSLKKCDIAISDDSLAIRQAELIRMVVRDERERSGSRLGLRFVKVRAGYTAEKIPTD